MPRNSAGIKRQHAVYWQDLESALLRFPRTRLEQRSDVVNLPKTLGAQNFRQIKSLWQSLDSGFDSELILIHSTTIEAHQKPFIGAVLLSSTSKADTPLLPPCASTQHYSVLADPIGHHLGKHRSRERWRPMTWRQETEPPLEAHDLLSFPEQGNGFSNNIITTIITGYSLLKHTRPSKFPLEMHNMNTRWPAAVKARNAGAKNIVSSSGCAVTKSTWRKSLDNKEHRAQVVSVLINFTVL